MMSNDLPELTDVPAPLASAMALWEHLAAYAWEQTIALGRGVVLVGEEDLLCGAQAKARGESISLPLGFVPMVEIPSGDDFLHIIRSYDVKRQVVLLVGRAERKGAEDDEQLFVLEANEAGRPLPEDCFFAMQEQA